MLGRVALQVCARTAALSAGRSVAAASARVASTAVTTTKRVTLENAKFTDITSGHRQVVEVNGELPFRGGFGFVAPNATLVGSVLVYDRATVWYNARMVGENKKVASLGFKSSLGDGSSIVTTAANDATVGFFTVIDAGVLIEGATVGNSAFIGAGSKILDGAVVGNGVHLVAGSVVPPGAVIPAGERWAGNPAVHVEVVCEDDAHHMESDMEAIYAQGRILDDEAMPYSDSYRELEREGISLQ
eukprot:c52513_g1_i1.p1 GENE.c52513_g1_i1~~c52513_g1_i1.p1  ORF type:complete len:244 (-),score=54.03 c52513_g1_i1:93-824(-)